MEKDGHAAMNSEDTREINANSCKHNVIMHIIYIYIII